MSIQPVITNQRASEVSASRRRGGADEGGEAFALPEQKEGEVAGAEKGDTAKAAEKVAVIEEAAAAGRAEKPAVTASGKGEFVVKPDIAVAKPSAQQPAGSQPETAVPTTRADFLVAMAAAQAEAAAAAGAAGEGTPKADGKPAVPEGEEKAVDGKEDKAAADGASQNLGVADIKVTVVPPPVVMLALSLPVATSAAGDAPTQAEKAPAIAVGVGAKPQQAAPLTPGFIAPAPVSADAASTAGEGEGAIALGKATVDAGHVAGVKNSEEQLATGAGSKAEGASAAAAPVPADPKPLENLQQLLGPLDLSSMLQQAGGKPGQDRLVQPLDPNLMPNGAATAQSQANVTGQPTPIHVVPIEIGLRAMSGSKQFDIRLDPDELGRVDVNLSISDKGEVSARLVVDRVETLHLLQRDARTLERAFEQAGLKPSDGGVDISLRDPSDQSAFRQNRQHDEAPQRPRLPHGAELADDASLSHDPVPQRRLVRLGGVDLSI